MFRFRRGAAEEVIILVGFLSGLTGSAAECALPPSFTGNGYEPRELLLQTHDGADVAAASGNLSRQLGAVRCVFANMGCSTKVFCRRMYCPLRKHLRRIH